MVFRLRGTSKPAEEAEMSVLLHVSDQHHPFIPLPASIVSALL